MQSIVSAFFLLLVLLLPVICNAQPDGFGGFGGDAPVPLDGGLVAAVVAGVGYGAKKLNDRRKKNISE